MSIGFHSTEIPDLIEPVIGYRGFRLDIRGKEIVLTSPHRARFIWSREKEAECPTCLKVVKFDFSPIEKIISTPPGKECSCGLYCYYDLERALPEGEIIGLVTCSGVIEAHSLGMRAQKMRIEALASKSKTNRDVVHTIPWIDDIPIFSDPKELETIASEYGAPLPEDMRESDEDDLEW